MENRQILDLEAMETFKNNLFEKKIGGLSTSLTASGDAYNVQWDASHFDLGKTIHHGTGQSADAYCSLSVSDAFVDSLTFYANAGKHTLEGLYMDVYSLGSRLNALGFRKAPSFGHGAVSQYVGNLRNAAGGLGASVYPNYNVGWSRFEYVSDATAFLDTEPKNDFSLLRIGKIAIVRGSAWYRFSGYVGTEPSSGYSPELLLRVSIPEGFRMVLGGMRCLGFSALVTNQGAYSHSPAAFPGKDCFIYDYGIDGLGKLQGTLLGGNLTESPFIGQPDSSDPNMVSYFWLRCPTGPDKSNGYSIRLSLNGWWQCEEDLPEPTDWK